MEVRRSRLQPSLLAAYPDSIAVSSLFTLRPGSIAGSFLLAQSPGGVADSGFVSFNNMDNIAGSGLPAPSPGNAAGSRPDLLRIWPRPASSKSSRRSRHRQAPARRSRVQMEADTVDTDLPTQSQYLDQPALSKALF